MHTEVVPQLLLSLLLGHLLDPEVDRLGHPLQVAQGDAPDLVRRDVPQLQQPGLELVYLGFEVDFAVEVFRGVDAVTGAAGG